MTTGQQELAGFGWRLAAQVVDTLWLLPLSMLLVVIADAVNGGEMSLGGEVMINLIGALLVLSFWVQRQATPGKAVFGLVIVDAATGGAPPFRQYVVRYLGYLLSALPLGLGYFWMLWDERRQTWHDKLAGTLVMRQRPAG